MNLVSQVRNRPRCVPLLLMSNLKILLLVCAKRILAIAETITISIFNGSDGGNSVFAVKDSGNLLERKRSVGALGLDNGEVEPDGLECEPTTGIVSAVSKTYSKSVLWTAR